MGLKLIGNIKTYSKNMHYLQTKQVYRCHSFFYENKQSKSSIKFQGSQDRNH